MSGKNSINPPVNPNVNNDQSDTNKVEQIGHQIIIQKKLLSDNILNQFNNSERSNVSALGNNTIRVIDSDRGSVIHYVNVSEQSSFERSQTMRTNVMVSTSDARLPLDLQFKNNETNVMGSTTDASLPLDLTIKQSSLIPNKSENGKGGS